MSRKPPAALSAGLVAVKGMAAPAPDMPGRAGPPMPAAPPLPDSSPFKPHPDESSVISTVAPPATEADVEKGLSPLNFRISANFRREFKTYAARHDLKLNELLRLSFEAYRKALGD